LERVIERRQSNQQDSRRKTEELENLAGLGEDGMGDVNKVERKATDDKRVGSQIGGNRT
jgi:hypothetical protein